MTTMVRMPARMADVLSWWDESGLPRRTGLGLFHDLRIEDFVEDDTYVLRAEVPGVDPDKDLDIYIEGDLLVVQGERRESQHDKNHQEFHYGSFDRAVRLPQGVDKDRVTATYQDGVLDVRVPFTRGAPAVPRQRIAVAKSSDGG